MRDGLKLTRMVKKTKAKHVPLSERIRLKICDGILKPIGEFFGGAWSGIRRVTESAARRLGLFELPLYIKMREAVIRLIANLKTRRAIAAVTYIVIFFVLISVFVIKDLKTAYIFEDETMLTRGMVVGSAVESMLKRADIGYAEFDTYTVKEFGDSLEVYIHRAYPVMLVHDGVEETVMVSQKNVTQILEMCEISLGKDDYVNEPLNYEPVENDVIKVTRVDYYYDEKQEKVERGLVYKPSPLIPDGEERIVMEGEDGLASRTYLVRREDGVAVSSELVNDVIINEPKDVVIIVGTSGIDASLLKGEDFTDIQVVNNAPETYERVIADGVCTAYYYPEGTFGASGMYMRQGFVAVNTDVIPYGSLLYITSADGSFTYGWAVAADVGEAMMDGRVDIDCFFESYNESCYFGKKLMNIYVVEQLTQEELEDYVANRAMFTERVPTSKVTAYAVQQAEQGEVMYGH